MFLLTIVTRCSRSAKLVVVKRIVILGPGASGKSTLASRLGEITGLPVVELDKIFWQPGLLPTPRNQWIAVQQPLVEEDSWIMDGDLGPYDALEIRLRVADTIVFLDFSILRCAWRALRRSHERIDFWLWLLSYKYRSRPILMRMIAEHASRARLMLLKSPREVGQFLTEAKQNSKA